MSYNYIKLPISIDSVLQVSVDAYSAAIENPKLYTGLVNVMFVSYEVDSPGTAGLWSIKVKDEFGAIKFQTASLSLSSPGTGSLSAIGEFNLEDNDVVVFDTSEVPPSDTFTLTLSAIKYNYDVQYVTTPTPTPTITLTPTPTPTPPPTPTPTITPTPSPTPTESYMSSCSASDPLSAIGCNNSINWTLSSDDDIQFFEVYRACSATEHYLPLSAYELIDVIYDPSARQYVDWYQPGCRICRYLIAAGNPRMTMMVPYISAVGCVGPTCTPTPTPTYPCFDYDFDIGDPGGVRYVRVLSEEFTQAVKYVKCTNIGDERYLPIIPPTPPANPARPYCLTPTPTPTFLAQEFDMCFPTPTPTPTPTVIGDEFEFITPTPSPTPTPTPTAPYDGILVDGAQSCLSFIESRFNDNDYITVWVKSLTKPPHERFEILCKKLLIPSPGLTYCVPMDLDEEMEVTVVAESEGMYPPCTLDVAYDGSVVYKDIFLKERERFKFNMLRRS